MTAQYAGELAKKIRSAMPSKAYLLQDEEVKKGYILSLLRVFDRVPDAYFAQHAEPLIYSMTTIPSIGDFKRALASAGRQPPPFHNSSYRQIDGKHVVPKRVKEILKKMKGGEIDKHSIQPSAEMVAFAKQYLPNISIAEICKSYCAISAVFSFNKEVHYHNEFMMLYRDSETGLIDTTVVIP